MKIIFILSFLFACNMQQKPNNTVNQNKSNMRFGKCRLYEWLHIVDSKKVFASRDAKDRVTEIWGNPKWVDFNTNFHVLYFYDSSNRLTSFKDYNLERSNTQCKIIDSTDYREVTFFYYDKDTLPYKSIQNNAIYDVNGKVVHREFSHICDCATGEFIHDSTQKRYTQ